jgi:hypothetical protein
MTVDSPPATSELDRSSSHHFSGAMRRWLIVSILMAAVPCAVSGQDAVTPCNVISEIKVLPHKDEAAEDEAYIHLLRAGREAFACLVDRITDTTPMPDPRKAPKYADTRVGDVAHFILANLTGVPFDEFFPEEVKARYRVDGVYAFFEFVANPLNRAILQERWRSWLAENAYEPCHER